MSDDPRNRTHLFTLRVWTEGAGRTAAAWRGKIQHVATGEARDVGNWDALMDFVMATIRGGDDPQTVRGKP